MCDQDLLPDAFVLTALPWFLLRGSRRATTLVMCSPISDLAEPTVPLFTDEHLAQRFLASPMHARDEAGRMTIVRLVSWDSGAVLLDDLAGIGVTRVAFDIGSNPAPTLLYPIAQIRDGFWNAPPAESGEHPSATLPDCRQLGSQGVGSADVRRPARRIHRHSVRRPGWLPYCYPPADLLDWHPVGRRPGDRET